MPLNNPFRSKKSAKETEAFIASLENEIESLRQALKEKTDSEEELTEENARIKEELQLKNEACSQLASKNNKLKENIESFEKENNVFKNRIKELEKEIQESGDIDKRLEEFEKKLVSFETLKKNYEKKINYLQSNLLAAKRKLAAKTRNSLFDSPSDLPEDLENDDSEALNPFPLKTTEDPESLNRDFDFEISEWEDNEHSGNEIKKPETVIKKKRGPVFKEKKAPGMPDKFREANGDNWLLSLPDNL